MAYNNLLHSPAGVNRHYWSIITVTNTHTPSTKFISSYTYSTSKIVTSSHRSSLRWGLCGSTNPHLPSPPPESSPPFGDEQDSRSGSVASFSRLQESVQIFFAVFFWMSLFFWSSVWDGRNNGRSDKGPPRFWK